METLSVPIRASMSSRDPRVESTGSVFACRRAGRVGGMLGSSSYEDSKSSLGVP